VKIGRRSALAGVAVLAAAHGRLALADPADVPRVLGRIAAARDGLKTWRAGFTQERTIGLLATKIRSHGTAMLVRPDRLRWQLDPPDAATYWVTPAGVAYASADGHGSVPASDHGRPTVTDAMADLNTLLGGDLAKLGDRYQLSVAETPAEVTVTAQAKDPSHGLRGFVLGFAPGDLGSPTRATLLEAGKDRSEITFEQPQKNAPIDPALMRPTS
jgi:outer membrane lipoprotein-sorting protein